MCRRLQPQPSTPTRVNLRRVLPGLECLPDGCADTPSSRHIGASLVAPRLPLRAAAAGAESRGESRGGPPGGMRGGLVPGPGPCGSRLALGLRRGSRRGVTSPVSAPAGGPRHVAIRRRFSTISKDEL